MQKLPCRDCGAAVGQPHLAGCDIARCLWTGGQRIQCGQSLAADCCRVIRAAGGEELANELADYLGLENPEHDCGEDVWTGEWPGDAECREYGFWCYWGPDMGEQGWVRCGPPGSDPDVPFTIVREDLNRLLSECAWDSQAKRWVRR